MTSTTVVFIPGMLKALRLVRVYGFMVERRDGLYYPGSNQPACSKALAEKMVEGGWPTEKGWHAGEAG
ncbi:hypothetical protein [Bradyrhizobium sp. RT3a]|uniref:hypothetical protein n=1 Tax=unclassified Bradyrhizobium TaxID=2631580 RepID=UPI00339749EE